MSIPQIGDHCQFSRVHPRLNTLRPTLEQFEQFSYKGYEGLFVLQTPQDFVYIYIWVLNYDVTLSVGGYILEKWGLQTPKVSLYSGFWMDILGF
jgi:hypothetical protein